MEPKLSNELMRAFNKFVKEIFHSSTLSLRIENSNTSEYKFYAKGTSNRLVKQIWSLYGKEFTEKLLSDILLKNMDLLIEYIEEISAKKFAFVSFDPIAEDECFILTLQEIQTKELQLS